jgi:acetylornithine deacetylase/succinyl-diaminopimelate desuccinylase-like protein
MALWRREAGAACVVYGPGDIAHAHAVDEHVSLDEVATTARVLEAAVRILLR